MRKKELREQVEYVVSLAREQKGLAMETIGDLQSMVLDAVNEAGAETAAALIPVFNKYLSKRGANVIIGGDGRALLIVDPVISGEPAVPLEVEPEDVLDRMWPFWPPPELTGDEAKKR